ncbi:response regulator transcription factor [Thermobrachium celere]|uniref:Stage 0 sporulation protein A homolog n=1 Tax=Thermobrachium celere DSM 8682 TaxID=941824 RepID=R7RQD3_9CLOT|nr:response regulator transcription factor [Thermobrachium celere]CDF57493.1 Response regulator (CheY-like domain and HTH-type DNA-binding domain) [Thermobrachium celere DSM 8682]
MKETILVVEDEERTRKLICAYLNKEDYNVLEAANGFEAINILKKEKVHLVLLDVMMPVLDGWQTLIEVRKFSDVPVIMLTAKADDEDKLLGYSLGVDVYLTKPISPKVVLASVSAMIKRVYHSKNELLLDVVDGLKIDEAAYSVFIDSEEVILSPKEFELLLYLYKNKGIILTREQILDNVWGLEKDVDLRTVDTHIRRIREKLKDKAYLITTIRGVGYKFDCKNER